jgi:hypothetical protein
LFVYLFVCFVFFCFALFFFFHFLGCCRYGTLLRIEELQMLPDGRSLIVAVGVRKFKMNETGESLFLYCILFPYYFS